jgi:hypothetical protein
MHYNKSIFFKSKINQIFSHILASKYINHKNKIIKKIILNISFKEVNQLFLLINYLSNPNKKIKNIKKLANPVTQIYNQFVLVEISK